MRVILTIFNSIGTFILFAIITYFAYEQLVPPFEPILLEIISAQTDHVTVRKTFKRNEYCDTEVWNFIVDVEGRKLPFRNIFPGYSFEDEPIRKVKTSVIRTNMLPGEPLVVGKAYKMVSKPVLACAFRNLSYKYKVVDFTVPQGSDEGLKIDRID